MVGVGEQLQEDHHEEDGGEEATGGQEGGTVVRHHVGSRLTSCKSANVKVAISHAENNQWKCRQKRRWFEHISPDFKIFETCLQRLYALGAEPHKFTFILILTLLISS